MKTVCVPHSLVWDRKNKLICWFRANFITIFTLIILLFSFTSCEEVERIELQRLVTEHGTVTVERYCYPGALGSCYLDIDIVDENPTFFNFKKLLVKSSLRFNNANLEILDNDFLLIRMRLGQNSVIEPHIIYKVDEYHGTLKIDDSFNSRKFNYLSYIEGTKHEAESYQSISNKSIFCIHFWNSEETMHRGNVYFVGAESINFSFISENIINAEIKWINKQEKSNIFIETNSGTGKMNNLYYEELPEELFQKVDSHEEYNNNNNNAKQ